MEIMSKPGIFFGLKRHCAKNKGVWIECLPAPEPILHHCIELLLKSLTKGKYPYHRHLRKDESHDQLWGVLGDLVALKCRGRGLLPLLGFPVEHHSFVLADSTKNDNY